MTKSFEASNLQLVIKDPSYDDAILIVYAVGNSLLPNINCTPKKENGAFPVCVNVSGV